MEPDVVALFVGLGAAVLIGAVAWAWPAFSAPRIAPSTVLDEAERHPSLARVLLSRVDAARLGEVALGGALVAAVIGGALIGVLAWMIRSHAGLARYDLSAANWGATHATSDSTSVLRDISLLGGTLGSTLVVVVVAAVASVRLPFRRVITFLAVVVIGQLVLANSIKALVARARPDIDRLTGFSGSSFPSGHATTSAAVFAAAALLLGYGRGRITRAVLTGVAGGIAVAVAATRVLLGVHWLTDVLAGLLLGWTWFAVVSVAFGGRLLRVGEPIAVAERAMDLPEPVGPRV